MYQNLSYTMPYVAICCREPRSFKDHINTDNVCVTDSEAVTEFELPADLTGSAIAGNAAPLATSSQGTVCMHFNAA